MKKPTRLPELCVTLVLIALVPSCARRMAAADLRPSFDGGSEALKRTQVLPTLDSPIPDGKNAIWCVSFLAAWKTLEKELIREPVSFEKPSSTAQALSKAADPRPNVPKGALYTAAGWRQQGIIRRIADDLRKQFPEKEPPTFPDITEDSFVAYSYLEARVRFTLPYFQNRNALTFTDSAGQTNGIRGFGIRPEDDYAYGKLRSQAHVLFRKDDERREDFQFAVDLCADSSPNQIVVARIPRPSTLAEALDSVAKGIEGLTQLRKENPASAAYYERIGPNDVLLVPDLFWKVAHHFLELEGQPFRNQKLKGQRMDVAQQDILFRLDRSGAELKSEAKTYMMPVPTHFLLDRPFLIYVKKRDAKMPYFAMWVDNAELLQQWKP